MAAPNLELSDADVRQSRRLLSECWIYTSQRGLREVTLFGNGSTIAIDGQKLRRWCVVDSTDPESTVGLVYSAEMPSPDLKDQVAQLARERFKTEAWPSASPGLVSTSAGQR